MRILSVNFQRNGIQGESFYSVMFADYSFMKNQNVFLATFKTPSYSEKHIDISSCRVVEIDNNNSSWRGDEVAYRLQNKLHEMLTRQSYNSFYDLTTKAEEMRKYEREHPIYK